MSGTTYLLELLHQGVIDLAVHGGENTSLGDGAIENLLDGDGAWDTHCIGRVGSAKDVAIDTWKIGLRENLTSLGHG